MRQEESKRPLVELLIDRGSITEKQWKEVLGRQVGAELIDLSKTVIPPEMTRVLSKNLAKKHHVVPVKLEGDTIYLAMGDPLDFIAVEDVKTATRKRVIPLVAAASEVEQAITTLYGNEGAARAIEEMQREARVQVSGSAAPEEGAAPAPTVRLVNSILERAVAERASDIHLEPYEEALQVRMRIDGVMRKILTIPKDFQSSVLARLKVMGDMDIAERKIPQDGRSVITVQNREIDLRMSTLPTIYGESFAIRLLDRSTQLLEKEAIGLAGADLKRYDALLSAQSGMILIAGPTGSGKSSTMYAMIRQLNTEQVNLITLEDPVEYHIDGIKQVPIQEKTGMTFSNGLRAILRQDPDIIAVGEIRDGETAQIAVRAAMTGHLVLSTVHTSSAVAAIDRLVDIGVEPYLIAGALRGILAQRLVRRICPYCKEEYTPTEEELESINLTAGHHSFYRGAGCPMCFHTGYRGRTGVFELLLVSRALRQGIAGGWDREKLRSIMEEDGFVSLAGNCRRLVLEGITTIEEARRAIHSAAL